MSKATRNKQQAARDRIAAQRAAAHRAEVRNRALLAGGSVLVVIAVVVVFVVIKLSSSSAPSPAGSTTGTALPASVVHDITNVPATTLAAVGKGTTSSLQAITGAPLTSGGKPELLYIGAEYCPLCAAERWSLAVALSRFGTFSPLHGIHSSSTDSYPNTATLTFYKSSYSSKYLVFTPVENEKVDRSPLQNTTPQQQQLWDHYQPDPATHGYPFIDLGNKYLAGVTYDPQVLHGLNWSQIAAALQDPSSKVAKGAVGSANMFTAAICKLTGNQPASVCTAAPIPALQAQL